MRLAILAFGLICAAGSAQAQAQMVKVGSFEIDATEVTISQFRAFAKATGWQTKAEKEGGGSV